MRIQYKHLHHLKSYIEVVDTFVAMFIYIQRLS